MDQLFRYAAGHPAHPMTPFVPLFVDRSPGSDMTVAEMYLGHTFPSYGRTNTERALRGSGIVFPPVDETLLDLHIARLVAAGFLREPAADARPGRRSRARRQRMAVSDYRDWETFDMSSAPGDCPVAFCGDLRPASLLGAYRRGIMSIARRTMSIPGILASSSTRIKSPRA